MRHERRREKNNPASSYLMLYYSITLAAGQPLVRAKNQYYARFFASLRPHPGNIGGANERQTLRLANQNIRRRADSLFWKLTGNSRDARRETGVTDRYLNSATPPLVAMKNAFAVVVSDRREEGEATEAESRGRQPRAGA